VIKILTLRKRGEFLAVARDGQRVITKGLILQATKNMNFSDNNTARLGFTVSGRTGNAIVRNRIKRRLREVARQVVPQLAHSGFDYVVIGRKAALERPFEGLIKDIRYAMHNVHPKNL